jgi:hypothetical protein
LAALREYLGHADIQTTMIYAHLSPAQKRKWIQLIDGAPIARKNKKPPGLPGVMEREKGFEPSTPALARRCSTAELFPHLVRRRAI